MAKKTNRRGMLAKVHILKKDLGMTDDQYRDMLEDLTRKRSAGDLTSAQLARIIDHMSSLLNGPKQQRPFERNPGESPQMMKIKALLLAGKRPLAYGDALADRLYGVKRLEWVKPHQLGGIIGTLEKQAQREGWPTEGDCA